jgi:uncharacterized delta-60 repeat protein
MNLSKAPQVFVLIIVISFMLNACSNGKSPIEPAMNDGQIILQDIPDSIGEQCDNRTILAGYEATIDPVAKEFTITPTNRNSQYHLELINIYPGVLEIVNYGWTPNFWANIKLTHPYPDTGIDGFDPRVIAIIPANPGVSMNFPVFNVQANNSVILEPDGYTKLFDSVNPIAIGNANPFIAYFKDEPNRVWSSTETTAETKRWEMDLSGFGGPLRFVLVVDVSANYPNAPQPIVDNAPEPVQIEVTIDRGLTIDGGESLVEVTLLDWQGQSNVKCKIEVPQIFNGAAQLNYSRPGPNPDEYIFSGTISNSLHAPTGLYDVLIAAWDIQSDVHVFIESTTRVFKAPAAGDLVWAKSAGGGNLDEAFGITTLSDDSTVVTGAFRRTATFGKGEINETILIPTGNSDIFIARFNADGTLAWAKRAGGENWSRGLAISALSDDSIIATGYFCESATFGFGEPNETKLITAGNCDIFVARYEPEGTLEWVKGSGGSITDKGTAITTLSDDSVVVTGHFEDIAIFASGEPNETVLTSYGAEDVFIARYNPDGTLMWCKHAVAGSWPVINQGITSLDNDSIVITGAFWEPSAIFGPGEPKEVFLTSDDQDDIFIARYDSDGSIVWAKRAGGLSRDGGYEITSLSNESIVVTGYFQYSAVFGPGEINEITLNSEGQSDIFIGHFNSGGELVWVKQCGAGGNEGGLGITILKDNSTVVTGIFSLDVIFGQGEANETILSSAGMQDMFIARYNQDGTLIWAKSNGGSSQDEGYGVTSLSDDTIVSTGTFSRTVIFGTEELNETIMTSDNIYPDIFVARFEP